MICDDERYRDASKPIVSCDVLLINEVSMVGKGYLTLLNTSVDRCWVIIVTLGEHRLYYSVTFINFLRSRINCMGKLETTVLNQNHFSKPCRMLFV